MKKLISIVVLAIVVIVLIVIFGGSSAPSPTAQEPIKIGGLFTLTGPLASYGEFQKQAAEFAVKEVNDAGGVDGRPVQLLIEDTGSDAKKGVDAYNILKLKGVTYYVVEYSPVAAAVRPLAVGDGYFLITSGATTPAYVDGNSLSCRMTMTAQDIGRSWSQYLTETKRSRVSLLLPNNEYGKGVADEFAKAFTANTGTIVVTELYDASGPADFRTPITKIKARMADTDALVAVNSANTVEPFLQQILSAGWSKLIVTDYNTVLNPALKDKKLIEGVEYIDWSYQPAPDALDSTTTKSFKDAYVLQYGIQPSLPVAGYYDGVRMLLEGLKKGGTSPEKVSAYILTLKNVEAVTGNIAQFDADCQAQRDTVMRKVLGGSFIKIK